MRQQERPATYRDFFQMSRKLRRIHLPPSRNASSSLLTAVSIFGKHIDDLLMVSCCQKGRGVFRLEQSILLELRDGFARSFPRQHATVPAPTVVVRTTAVPRARSGLSRALWQQGEISANDSLLCSSQDDALTIAVARGSQLCKHVRRGDGVL